LEKHGETDRIEILPAFPASSLPVPAIIAAAGDSAREHFLECFAANIRNVNTRAAYVQAAAQFFDWCGVPQAQAEGNSAIACSRLHRAQAESHEPADR